MRLSDTQKAMLQLLAIGVMSGGALGFTLGLLLGLGQ